MAAYLPNTLEQLVRAGVNITIEDVSYLPQTLFELALIAKGSGSHITIAGNYLPATLEKLAQIAGGQLTVIVKK